MTPHDDLTAAIQAPPLKRYVFAIRAYTYYTRRHVVYVIMLSVQGTHQAAAPAGGTGGGGGVAPPHVALPSCTAL